MNAPVGSALDWLDEALEGAEVVVFRSRLTDVRPLQTWLARHPSIRVREELVEMGSGEQRERFQGLKTRTGWKTLPQVFVNGTFVGGQVEFFGHPIASLAERRGGAVPGVAPGEGRQSPTAGLIKALGYGGLIPFLAGVFALMSTSDPGFRGFAAGSLVAYGAVIAAFLGAAHWGVVLTGRFPGVQPDRMAVWTVLPSIAAWITLLLPVLLALPLQVALFSLIFAVDHRLGAKWGWPGYYRRLRFVLSAVVVIGLAGAWLILMAGT